MDGEPLSWWRAASIRLRLALWAAWFWPGDMVRSLRRRLVPWRQTDDQLLAIAKQLQAANARLIERGQDEREQAKLLRLLVAAYESGDEDRAITAIETARIVVEAHRKPPEHP